MKLDVKPIPIPKDAKHPPPPDERLPEHEFSMALVGKFILKETCDASIHHTYTIHHQSPFPFFGHTCLVLLFP